MFVYNVLFTYTYEAIYYLQFEGSYKIEKWRKMELFMFVF